MRRGRALTSMYCRIQHFSGKPEILAVNHHRQPNLHMQTGQAARVNQPYRQAWPPSSLSRRLTSARIRA